ncbi:CDP-6-deoxy-delta-3,4-glucoseen reductase [Melaminivora sp.]
MTTHIKLYPSGQSVACEEGQTVLEALERSGYALPNNCRAGACGECKVRVRSGEFDQGFVLDMALSQDERAQGYGLMCMAKPLSPELEIEWGTADAKPKLFPPREAQYAILVDRIARTPRITEFVLRPLGESMRFWPGQYVQLGEPGKGVPVRSYSLASAPRPDGEIRLQVTRVDADSADTPAGRTSRWLHDEVALGAQLRFSGPHGTFIGDPSVDTPVLCLAAGSGLAPILSLTEAALRRGFKLPVTLMFSARESADLYDIGLMRYWEARYPHFRYLPTLTRGPQEGMAGMLHGRIPAILGQQFPDLSGHSVFVAGTTGFVDDCVAAAKALGAQPTLIHTEGFFAQA